MRFIKYDLIVFVTFLIIGALVYPYLIKDSNQDSRFSGNADSFNFSGPSSLVHFKAKDIFLRTNETMFTNVRNITIESTTGEMRLINFSHSLQVLYNEKILEGAQSLSNVDITILFETSTKMTKNLAIIDSLSGSFNNINLSFLNDDKVVISRIGVNAVIIDGKELTDFNRIFFETDNTSTALFHLGKIDLMAWTVSDLNIVSPAIITNKAESLSEIILNDGKGVLRLNDHIFDIRTADTLEVIFVSSHFIVNDNKIKFVGISNSVKLNNKDILMSDFSYWLKYQPQIISGFGVLISAFLAALSFYLPFRKKIIEKKDEGKKILNVLLAEFETNSTLIEDSKKSFDRLTQGELFDFLGFKEDGFNTFRNQGGFQYITSELYTKIAGYYNSLNRMSKKISPTFIDLTDEEFNSEITLIENLNNELKSEIEKEMRRQ